MSVHHLIVSYGYLAVFVLVLVESLGVPLPGETTLVAAATYAGESHHLSVWGLFVVAAGSAVVGNAVGFWIGEFGGYRLMVRYGRYIRLDEPKIKVARYLFDRRGGVVVFAARFVSILRTYVAFLAGTSQMRFARFMVFSLLGALCWSALYSFTAYYAGSFLAKASTPFDVAAGILAVGAVVGAVVVVRRHLRRLEAVAEAAYPGPLEDRRRRGDAEDRGDEKDTGAPGGDA